MPNETREGLRTGQLLRERLAPAFDASGSQGAFADRAGIPRDTLSKYLSGTQPGPGALIKLADAAGVSIDYLVGRASSSVPSAGHAGNGESSAAISGVDGELVLIPRLQVQASAGGGRAVAVPAIVEEVLVGFRRSWLRSLGVSPANAEFLEAQGDSMSPTIEDGDLMLVDRGYGDVVNGKIYVLVVNGLVIVKRLQVLAFGGLMLISDNDKYPSETIPRSEVNDLSIEARVAWYGRAI